MTHGTSHSKTPSADPTDDITQVMELHELEAVKHERNAPQLPASTGSSQGNDEAVAGHAVPVPREWWM